MPSAIHEILWRIIANAAFALLAFLYKRLAQALIRKDPRWRRALLMLLTACWLTLNLAYQVTQLGGYVYFFLISSVILTLVVGGELNRFWAIGLLGADNTAAGGLDYLTSLSLCRKSLDFLGVGASKLTRLSSAFEATVQRCHNELRPIRFLLCDPENQKLETFAHQAGDPEGEYRRRVKESLRIIADLHNRKRMNIEVRLYGGETMPLFRLMFIDDALCLLSHYRFGAGDGSDLPQIHVHKTSGGLPEAAAFYHALKLYFERLWEQSTPWDFVSKIQQ